MKDARKKAHAAHAAPTARSKSPPALKLGDQPLKKSIKHIADKIPCCLN